MLQMTVDGQDGVEGSALDFYGPGGALTESFTLGAGALVGEAQRTILLARPEAAAQSGFPAPDFVLDAGDALDPAGGALCFSGDYPPDCATWGSFPAVSAGALPDPQDANAAAILGDRLGRPIDAGCATWLDPDDDSRGSDGHFFDGLPAGVPPEPSPAGARNNAAGVPSGAAPCSLTIGFNGTPRNPTNETTAVFAFGTVPPEYGAVFWCRFAPHPIGPPAEVPFVEGCDPLGEDFGGLADGSYDFEVFVVGAAGGDPTTIAWEWEVDTVPPETTITSTPPPLSNGFAASFSFASSEPFSSFLCRLEEGPIQTCEPGRTYFNLADGPHLFRVWATDNAGNLDPSPAAHTFQVDTAFGDVFPPHTSILRRPPSRSSSTSAFFTYASSEPRSGFQCRLDRGEFESCPAQGASYGRLRNGRHSFAVRAVDRAGNLDPSPAAYAWTVRGALPRTRIVRAPPGAGRLRGARAKTVLFAFRADAPGARFRCRLDRARFGPCRSPRRFRAGAGRHRFEVYAVDALGNKEATPQRRIFRLIGSRGGLFGGGGR